MMECSGKLCEVSKDWKSRKFRLTFEIAEDITGSIDKLSDCERLDLKVKKHREKRSLNANGLLWKCIGDIADALRTDKWQVYLTMLKRYGKFTYIVVKEKAVDAVKAQWRECEVIGEITVNGQKAVQMLCYFGSSTLDSKEFSALLDGVISEMKEMGLETPMQSDLKRVIDEYEEQRGKA